MIVGCYSVDLYCDYENMNHFWHSCPPQFTGETEAECLRDARRCGWRFSRGKRPRLAKCPECVKAKINKVGAQS
jgi:hypothetical protein